MKLVDLATGPDWIVWIVFVIFAVFSIILLSGHGVGLFPDIIRLQRRKGKKYDERSYAEQ